MPRWNRWYGLLFLLFALNAVWNEHRRRAMEAAQAGRGAAHVRDMNELRALLAKPEPEFDVPTGPDVVIVRVGDLARAYRDSVRTADGAYRGRRVAVPLTHYVKRGSELHWHLAQADMPAVVVFAFP